ncbi:probable serine/threonine-protein kinase kinX [Entelurus aequoreus]|uniref:probable serine/threonine-protein kinase kinX n=1 Tax=Entelurus aequoreus TaxID=161455 RepID=UPI002B1D0CEC|nr:probable serine/threonine-protein kinase kinX [Entelurus aequoreus]XP_061879209.1 probable serine/threonine-protein kinase kinX [Entelurus aequoreus]
MRRVRRKVANKEKVFGCDLLEHLNASSQDVPQVLRCCTEFVEQHGIVDGIYRLSGVSSNIQKLRSEFESDGTPELNKEVYLQDIHCVSSLCKAYFRELPNPLLTYQLYDKFAEAVAVQLEEERLVKIRDVLKELSAPHYRTLEFLMSHLAKMASYSPETNMHARNLAIVWAPNLLRSKDIEVSGFNGTAAFMEVRIQSIVVEFILTHAAQLFPEPSISCNRRKSLPSPTAILSQEEPSLKAHPPANFGNISPGDGPLPIRPYHAIIEGTDKRKGSFKQRKWMSIFNIGGRFHDPRRRHKHSGKEKDRPSLRPARSMDSLSIPLYSKEGSKQLLQTSNSTKMSGLEAAASPGQIGGSEYAVTYRRGTGLVSGGTQGIYTALDPEGLGSTDTDTVLSRSPGLTTKVGRRAAMHITGPTIVTVPLHITSNLALGVLQGGGCDRVVHRGRDKEGEKVEVRDRVDKVERKDSGQVQGKIETEAVTNRKEVLDEDVLTLVDKKEEDKKERMVCGWEIVTEDQCVPKETHAKSLNSNADEDVEGKHDLKEMQGEASDEIQREATEPEDNNVFDSSDVLNSTEVEPDDQELSGYVQDNFEFLDQMDCSVLDHMDGSVSCQVPLHLNEFSVEPPGHSDDEYELMEQASHHSTGTDISPNTSPETGSQNQPKPHRQLSVKSNERQAKSLSLPHMTSPVCEPDSCSDEDITDDEVTFNYSSEEEDSLFVKSLPPDFFLNNLCDLQFEASCTTSDDVSAQVDQSQRCEVSERHLDCSTSKQLNDGEEIRGDMEDGQEREEIPQNNDNVDYDENSLRTTNKDHNVMETGLYHDLKPLPLEAPSHQSVDLSKEEDTDESNVVASDVLVDTGQQEDEEEGVRQPQVSIFCGAQKETEETKDVSRGAGGVFKADQDGGQESEWTEDTGQDREETGYSLEQNKLETKRSISEALANENSEELPLGLYNEKMEECHSGLDDTIKKIWDEIEEVICELIEDEEKKMGARQVGDCEDTQVSFENLVHFEEEVTNKSKCDMEATEDEMETNVGKDVQDKTNLAEMETNVGKDVQDKTNLAEMETNVGKDLQDKTTLAEMETNVGKDVQDKTNLAEMETNVGKDVQDKTNLAEMETNVGKDVQDKTNLAEMETNVGKDLQDKTTLAEMETNVGKDVQDKTNLAEKGDQKAAKEKKRSLEEVMPSLKETQLQEVSCDVPQSKEPMTYEMRGASQGAAARKLVISKSPRVYQVKAVPVVPPKPQHCKLAALNLRQQQQQRERRDADVSDEEARVKKESVHRKDSDDGVASRDSLRDSPLSMCFDEAVAIATLRRGKEKECERERQRDWAEVQ